MTELVKQLEGIKKALTKHAADKDAGDTCAAEIKKLQGQLNAIDSKRLAHTACSAATSPRTMCRRGRRTRPACSRNATPSLSPSTTRRKRCDRKPDEAGRGKT